jgi:long-chain acyl-CoA synthetase
MKGRAAHKAGTASINEPEADDVYMFSYTSGTTGDPKGVKLTHKMVIGAGYATNTRLGVSGSSPLDEEDSYISYLPAAHSFEQAVSAMSMVTGMKIGFFGGNVLKLTEDMQILKPTLFPSVPRLYNKIYGKI